MKCLCKVCEGRGYVPCEECDGQGFSESAITSKAIIPSIEHRNHEKILDLHKQARAVELQCDELKKLMPHNTARYDRECEAVIKELETEAKKLL